MTARGWPQLVLALAVVGAIWLIWPTSRPIPAITFTLTDGKVLHSGDLRGKSILLTFWSISCATCLDEMPRLSELHGSLGDKGFMVLGVAMPHDPPTAVIETVARLAPAYPIALDTRGEISRSFGGVEVTPTRFLISPRGEIQYTETGVLDENRLRATLLTLRG